MLTPLNPTFYTVKLGFTGVYIIYLISVQNIDGVVQIGEAILTSSQQSMFWAEILKNISIFIWKLLVFVDEIFNIFE